MEIGVAVLAKGQAGARRHDSGFFRQFKVANRLEHKNSTTNGTKFVQKTKAGRLFSTSEPVNFVACSHFTHRINLIVGDDYADGN